MTEPTLRCQIAEQIVALRRCVRRLELKVSFLAASLSATEHALRRERERSERYRLAARAAGVTLDA